MEIKTYLNDVSDYKPSVTATKVDNCTPGLNIQTLDNGCRIKEAVSVTDNDDGTIEEVREIHEEVVPMRLKTRIIRKLQCVPIEEKMECIGEDGSTETTVRVLDLDLLRLDREPTTLERVASDVQALKASSTRVAAASGSRRSFWGRAEHRYGSKAKSVVDESGNQVLIEEEVVVMSSKGWGEWGLTTLAWVTLAVVAALITYSVL